MNTNRATKGFAGMALVGAVALGGPATVGVQTADAAPARSEIVHTDLSRMDVPSLRQSPAKLVTIGQKVYWVAKQAVSGVIQYVVVEGIQKLNFVASASPEAASAAFWSSIPTLSAGSVGSPDALVLLAKQAPNSELKSRTAFVKGNAEELFRSITSTSGCVSKGKNSASCGLQTVSLSPGSKSSKPTITVSTSVRSTKVVVLY